MNNTIQECLSAVKSKVLATANVADFCMNNYNIVPNSFKTCLLRSYSKSNASNWREEKTYFPGKDKQEVQLQAVYRQHLFAK